MSKIPISKESFVKIINQLEKHSEYLTKLYNLTGVAFEKIPYVDDILVEFLDELTNESNFVSCYCYDLDFGKEYKDGCFIIDNIPIDISTAEKLYEMLEENWNLKQKEVHDLEVKLP